MRAWTDPHQARTARHETHPVYDFLFTYYSFRPARLRRWHPGAGIVLRGATGYGPGYRDTADGSTVDVDLTDTQIDPASRWFLVPDDMQREIWPTEDYELVRSLVDAPLPEDDLFAGIAVPADARRAS